MMVSLLFKSKKIFYVTALCISILLVPLLVYGDNGIEEDILKAELPQYPESVLIKEGFDHKSCSKYVAYKVRLKFPASQVINYYDTQLSKLGYTVFNEDGYGDREWVNFNHSTGEWEETIQPPARYISTWTDNRKRTRLILVLDYPPEEKSKGTNNRVLFVDCRLSKFFDFRSLKKALNRVKETK